MNFENFNATYPFLFNWFIFGCDNDSYESVEYNRIILNPAGEFISLEGEGTYEKWGGHRGYGISGYITDERPEFLSFKEACNKFNLNVDMCQYSHMWKEHPLLKSVLNSGVPLSIKITSYGGNEIYNLIDPSYHVLLNQNTRCVLVCEKEEYNEKCWDATTIWWLFPNKKKYVPLGHKKSFKLLKQLRGEIPEWLEEKMRGFRTSGEGWKVIN